MISKKIQKFAELKDGLETSVLEVEPISDEDRVAQQASTGVWRSQVGEYQGYGQFVAMPLPERVAHILANFRPVGDEASKVMIRILFLNVVDNTAYAFIQALDLKAYLEGIGSRPWTGKFRYQVDLWMKCRS